MATILAYTSPALGNLYPMCPLLSALRERGHRIVLRTLARGVACGRQLGFDTAPIDDDIESIEMTDWMAANGREALRVAFEVFATRAPLEVERSRRGDQGRSPGRLIVDPNTWGAAVAAEASGLPWATFWPYTPLLRSPGTPPFGPGMRPWPGPVGRIRDRLLRPMVMNVGQQGDGRTRKRHPHFLGAGQGSVTAEDFVQRSPLMLVASAEPFQYPGFAANHEHVRMIGPCEFDPPTADRGRLAR